MASGGTLPSAGLNYNPAQYNQRTGVSYYDAGGSTVLLVFQRGLTEEDSQTAEGLIPGHDGAGKYFRHAPNQL